jgi:hypothetical protein
MVIIAHAQKKLTAISKSRIQAFSGVLRRGIFLVADGVQIMGIKYSFWNFWQTEFYPDFL